MNISIYQTIPSEVNQSHLGTSLHQVFSIRTTTPKTEIIFSPRLTLLLMLG